MDDGDVSAPTVTPHQDRRMTVNRASMVAVVRAPRRLPPVAGRRKNAKAYGEAKST